MELNQHLESACIPAEERLLMPDQMTAAQEDAIRPRLMARSEIEGWELLYRALFPQDNRDDMPDPCILYSLTPEVAADYDSV
jgi:hypothetical protein